jgi:phage terminase large subunit-like protein
VLAGRWVRLAAKRFLSDLERDQGGWKYTYSETKANATCALFEIFVHEKGALMGQQVRLGDWQCFIFCNVFGWLNRKTGYERFSEAFVLVPKGNGKSPMAAWVTLKLAFFHGEKGAEVYNCATTKEQAMEVFRVAKAIVDLLPVLRERFGIVSSTLSLYQPSTRSRVRPIAGKPKDGKAPSGVTNDEYHEQPDDTLRDSLKNAMDKRPRSLMFDISTAGDTIEGPCRRKQEDVQNILEGLYQNDRQFGIIYDVDEEVDWRTRDACVMANPNFGVSMDEEKTLESLAEAVRNPAKQNDFRCKRQDFWAQQTHAWMNMASWSDCEKQIVEDGFLEFTCYHGSDLASTLDLSGTIKLFVREREDGKPIYTAFAKAYLPEKRALDKTKQHLQAWVHEGFLIATEGSAIDYTKIEDDTVADIERFQVRELCFDARYAGQYAQRVSGRTGVIQALVKPSPEELSPAMKELEGAVEDGRFEHDGHPVLKWCVANVQARMNHATGNYHLPTKDEPVKKIDLAVALMIAMARARFCLQNEGDYIDPEVFSV